MALKPCYECKAPMSTRAKACPHCGARRRSPPWARTFGVLMTVIGIPVIVLVFLGAWQKDEQRLKDIAATTSPQDFAALEIYEPAANVEAHLSGGDHLLVTYNIDPWMLTVGTAKSTFNLELAKLVPAAFSKFRAIGSITVIATGTFKDTRGHDTRDEVFRATFSRGTAASIVWDKIAWDSLPELADDFRQYPRSN